MSNSNSVSNSMQDTKGSMKETAGKLTGDNSMQSEGKIDQYAAKAKDLVNDAAGSVQNATANMQEKAAGSGSSTSTTTGSTTQSSGGMTGRIADTIATTLHTVTEQLHGLTTGEKTHTGAGTVSEEINALKDEALAAAQLAQQKASAMLGKGQSHAESASSDVGSNTSAAGQSADSSAHSAKADGQRTMGDLKNQAHQAAGQFNSARAAGDASHITGKDPTVAEMAGAAVGQLEQKITGKSGSQTQGVLEQGKGILKGNAAEAKQNMKAAGNDAQSGAKDAQSTANRNV